jgi:hypothetical protein
MQLVELALFTAEFERVAASTKRSWVSRPSHAARASPGPPTEPTNAISLACPPVAAGAERMGGKFGGRVLQDEQLSARRAANEVTLTLCGPTIIMTRGR